MTERVLITCAPPNPNGDLHLGHLSGPFLGADVLRRYLAARGTPVVYVSYTDDHSCYVPRRAAEIGLDPHATAFRYTRRIEQTLSLADMLADYYEHPHREPLHDEVVQDHFLRLYKTGAIVEHELPTPYCVTCKRYLYEAYVRGRCRVCGAASDGTYCEECGYPQDPDGLLDGRCITCGDAPETRRSRRLVVRLADFADDLGKLYADSEWRPRVLDFCSTLLAEGLPDVPISRVDDYGLPVPLPGWEGHILDTWFSGIFGYVAATAAYGAALGRPQLWEEVWRDPDTTLVHFIGFDCSFSHAVLWPAMLLRLDYVTPQYVVTNEFYRLEGEKFSTSRGHAIWGSDFLREAPPDAVRLHLCLSNPEHEQTDFRMADFDRTVNDLLVGRLETWATTLLELLARTCESRVPEVASEAWPGEVRDLIALASTAVGAALEPAAFSPRQAAAALADIATGAAADLRRRAGSDSDALPAALAAHAELLAVVAAVCSPLMPAWSRHAWRSLGQSPAEDELPWPRTGEALVPAGQPVAGTFRRMFQRR